MWKHPATRGLDIIDLEEVAKLCKKHNILFVVDNCFATTGRTTTYSIWS